MFVTSEVSALTCFFSMYLLRFRIDLSCCVEVWGVEGRYGV